MKLEPKHLFAYAPYGVRCQLNLHILGWKDRKLSFDSGHDFYNKLEDGLVRLFLRPLSDLTKEIELNGEKIIPIEVISAYSTEIELLHDIKYGFISVMFWNMLLSWHFDIFGLIDAGLAIDINTVKF
jgi:hypothetical protein